MLPSCQVGAGLPPPQCCQAMDLQAARRWLVAQAPAHDLAGVAGRHPVLGNPQSRPGNRRSRAGPSLEHAAAACVVAAAAAAGQEAHHAAGVGGEGRTGRPGAAPSTHPLLMRPFHHNLRHNRPCSRLHNPPCPCPCHDGDDLACCICPCPCPSPFPSPCPSPCAAACCPRCCAGGHPAQLPCQGDAACRTAERKQGASYQDTLLGVAYWSAWQGGR